ncbi:MAG: hypothetical protein WC508_05800, partial [Patescibacteria group bacterium]
STFSQYKSTGADINVAADYNVANETAAYANVNEQKNMGGSSAATGTSLTVALAADTPAAGIVTSNAARYYFTKVNLTASSDGDVIVDSLTITRAGLAHDADFASVDIIDAATGLAINAYSKTFGSTHSAVVNEDITIPAGTTKSIILAGNMGALATYAGETPILQLSAVVLKGSATVIGTLPISGNYQTTNGTITIGTVDVVDGGDNPSASTQNVGTTGYILSSVKLTANSVEPVTVEKVSFTQNGSAGLGDLQNVKLIKANTGEVLATLATTAAKKITFPINLVLDKGKNVSLDISADIVGGSGRDISFDIDQTTDIVVKGNTYGYYITPTFATTGAGSTPQYNAANTVVGNGTLNIESGVVTPTNVAANKTQRTIGKLKFTAKGEKVNLTSVGWVAKVVGITGSAATTSDVTNLTVYDEAGSVVAGPIDPTTNAEDSTGTTGYMTATTTDTITVPIGTTTYTVKADLSSDFSTNDTIAVGINPGVMVGKGDSTGNSITATPAGTLWSTTLTVKTGSLVVTISGNPAAQSVVVGTQNFTFSNLNFDASDSATDVVITQLKIKIKTAGNAYPDLISGIKLYDGSTEILPNNYPGSTSYGTSGTTAADSATTTYLFNTGAFKILAGTSKVVTVKANIGSGPTISGSDTITVGSGEGGSMSVQDGEGNTITPTLTGGNGSAMTLSSAGTVYLTGKTTPNPAIVVSGTTIPVQSFVMHATNESLNIDNIGLTVGAPDGGIVGSYADLVSLTLYKDGTADPIGSVVVNGASATITPSTTLTLPKDADVNFTVNATFSTLNASSAAASGEGLKVTVSNYSATSAQSGGTVTRNGIGAASKTYTIFKSVPKIDLGTNTSKLTGNGQTVSIFNFKVSADTAGPIGLFKLSFAVSTSTLTLDPTTYTLWDTDSNTKVSDPAYNVTTLDTVAANGADRVTCYLDPSNIGATWKSQLIIDAGTTKNLSLKATVASGFDGSSAGKSSVSASLIGDSAFAGTAALFAGNIAGDGGVNDTEYNHFIWSDLNDTQYASTTATNSPMYYSGFRVAGSAMSTATGTGQSITN